MSIKLLIEFLIELVRGYLRRYVPSPGSLFEYWQKQESNSRQPHAQRTACTSNAGHKGMISCGPAAHVGVQCIKFGIVQGLQNAGGEKK